MPTPRAVYEIPATNVPILRKSCRGGWRTTRYDGGMAPYSLFVLSEVAAALEEGEAACVLDYSGLHLNEEGKKVGRNKRSVSGMHARAGNGLRPYPGLRKGMSPRFNRRYRE